MSTVIKGKELVQSPYGLLGKASEVIDLSDENGHWVSGFLHEIVDADLNVKNLPQRAGDPNADFDTVLKSVKAGSPTLEYTPFVIDARSTGTTMGADISVYKDNAKNNLILATQKSVEQELWTGKISELVNSAFTNPKDFVHNRHFQDDDYKTLLTTTAVSVEQGLSLLEEALGESTLGYEGVIHAPKRLASLARVREYLKDGVLRTNLHTPVVAGTGYTKIDDKYYMVATGPLTIVLGAIEVYPSTPQQAVNVRNNTVEYIASRPVGAFWNTSGLFVVEIDPEL